MKKTIFLLVIVVVIISGLVIFFLRQQNASPNQLLDLNAPQTKEIKPSETFIDYSDPSGFSFSYPDNLSISNTASDDSLDLIDPNAYADLQLFSKDVSGSLNLKITDTKLKSLDEWRKANNIPDSKTSVEKKLGELKAIEVKTNDRLTLASLDQGVLFTIEVPLLEQDFWMKVYDKVVSGFTFATPETTSTAGVSNSSEEVVFEGEEVIE